MAKTRVAVLGGGIGGLVAAYELSKTRWLRSRYEVTVYQMGWRLGGKGASGRNTTPEGCDRIEEHGLHIWLGSYQNAFQLMRDCYEHCYGRSLMPHSPLRTWQDAFKKQNLITLMEKRDGQWLPWQIFMPPMPGWPGEAEQCLSLEQLIARGMELLQGVRHETPLDVPTRDVVSPLTHLDRAYAMATKLNDQVRKRKQTAKSDYDVLRREVSDFRSGYRAGKSVVIDQSDVQRRRWILIDLATTLIRGILADVLIPGHNSLSVLDDEDFRQFLARHGAEPASIDSAPVRNTYEIVFGYEGGDESKPNFAAGTATRFLLRWVGTYRGGFIYEMQAGMGDVVFTPLYLTLKDRGVRFRFFHRVQSLHVDAAQKKVNRIRMAEQVALMGPDYNPLIEIKGVPSWPAAPLREQIDPTQATAIEQLKQAHPGLEPLESAYSPWTNHREFDLQLGTDFDKIVLNIPLAALRVHCQELIHTHPPFAEMVHHVGTVATQSFQLWLNKDAEQLGWRGSEPALLDSYLDSYADFSHLTPSESHPAGSVHNIAYFCKPLIDVISPPVAGPNAPYEQDAHEAVRAWSRDAFLAGPEGMRPIWPDAYDPATGNFRWDYLTDQRGTPGTGSDRFDSQYWCANVNPSDRYVQALTGTTKFRLKAEESGFANVALAGDWIRTGVDAGCIEGAVLGGMQAARAVSGWPKKISGELDFCGTPLTGCLGALGGFLLPVFDFFRCVWSCLRGHRTPTPLPVCSAVKPPYVERGGEQVFPHPYDFEDTILHAFVVEADYAALKALCDKHLNDPSGHAVDYWPVLNRVVVAHLKVHRAKPQIPGEYDYGFIQETDVSLFIPVVAFKGLVPIGISMFAPYLFVDHPWGILGGREVLGLHKIPSVCTPTTLGSSVLLEAHSHAVPATGLGIEVPQHLVLSVISDFLAPAAGGTRLAMSAASGEPSEELDAGNLHLASGQAQLVFDAAGQAMMVVPPQSKPDVRPDTAGAKEWQIVEQREAWHTASKLVFGRDLQVHLREKQVTLGIESLLPFGTLPMVTLKQFRDIADGRFACYQAITQSPAVMTGFAGMNIISDPLKLKIETLANQPLLADFGWSSSPIPIVDAWQMQFNFRVGKGTELWRA